MALVRQSAGDMPGSGPMVGADLTAAARDEPLAWPSAAFFILGASIMLWAGAGTAIVWLIG